MYQRKTIIIGIAMAASVMVGMSLATPPSGIVSGTVVARAAFQEPVDIKFKLDGLRGQDVIHVPEAAETVMQQIVLGPLGQTGWHSHPGPAVALIKSGALTIYSSELPGCAGLTYTAGQSFVDHGQGHVHLGANLSATDNVEIWVTYFDVPQGGAFRIDAPAPQC